MKKYRFKDGVVVTANTVEEAKQQHKVMAGNKIKDALLDNIVSSFNNIKDINMYNKDDNNILKFTSPVCRMLPKSCYSFYIFFEISKRPDEDMVLLRYRVEDYDEQMNYDFKWVVVNLKDAKLKIKAVLNAWDSFSKLLSKCTDEFEKFYSQKVR